MHFSGEEGSKSHQVGLTLHVYSYRTLTKGNSCHQALRSVPLSVGPSTLCRAACYSSMSQGLGNWWEQYSVSVQDQRSNRQMGSMCRCLHRLLPGGRFFWRNGSDTSTPAPGSLDSCSRNHSERWESDQPSEGMTPQPTGPDLLPSLRAGKPFPSKSLKGRWMRGHVWILEHLYQPRSSPLML